MDASLSNAHLVERTDVTAELCIARIRPDQGEIPVFEPGQYVTLGLPESDDAASRLVRRPYSIVSSPHSRDHIELLVAHVENGQFTSRFWALRSGSPIWLDPHIRGKFTLAAVPPDADLVMVATGTGIAPYMSMLRTYSGHHRWRRLAILYGARYAADLAYGDELAHLVAQEPGATYVPAVTREPAQSSWKGVRGRVTAIIKPDTFENLVGWPLNPLQTHVMLCGNPQMIDDAEAILKAADFVPHSSQSAGNLHFERYW